MTSGLDELGSVVRATVGLTMLFLVAAVALAPSVLALQEAEEEGPTTITVTEEPGVCSSQGSFCERLFEWTGNEGFAETTAWLVGTPLKVGFIGLIAIVANRLARRGIRRAADEIGHADMPGQLVSEATDQRMEERSESIGTLLRSTASVLIFTTATIWALDTLGVSIVPLIASLGIAGVAIGFGAQSFVEDVIAGVMLVIEDQIGVGDRVDVGVVEGTVLRLTLRSTVIVDGRGVQWYVPNSEIRHVANESQRKTQARVQVSISYSADLASAAEILREAAEELIAAERWQEASVEDVPTPLVVELGAQAVIFELRLFIDSPSRRALERALRQKVVEVAAAKDLELPNDQLDVWLRSRPTVPGVAEPRQ